jgi:UDP-N-acetyl-D-glucosamine dehydrogenase
MLKKIVVIGQGYVGLPLAIMASEAGYSVIGVDKSRPKVEKLNQGRSCVEDLEDSRVQYAVFSGRYKASDDFSYVQAAQVIVICVPTPLKSNREPDLSFLIDSIESCAKHLSKNSLIIIESTVAPGTTRNVVLPLIKKISGYSTEDFQLAFSPERTDPTNKVWTLSNTPKLISGLNKESCDSAEEFYSDFIDVIFKCSSFEVAETTKLMENSFRLVNISFINEMLIFCQRFGIDIHEVIEAASTKPYGFMSFHPSVGVGGHCIPVDPIYLASTAKEVGVDMSMIRAAYEINQNMPRYFVEQAELKLGKLAKKKILVVGVAYKPNVADVRETPAEELIKVLEEKGAIVSWHDDLVKEWKGQLSTGLDSQFDLAIVTTPHDYLNLSKLGQIPILSARRST